MKRLNLMLVAASIGLAALLTGCSAQAESACPEAVQLKSDLRALFDDVPDSVEGAEAQSGEYDDIAERFRALSGTDGENEAFGSTADAIDDFTEALRGLRNGKEGAQAAADESGNALATRLTQVSAVCDDL